MIKLYGFAVSNYFNMARLALMEKGAPFDWVEVYPSQEQSFLQRSPVGKVPCLETGSGFLAETSVILEYIEDAVPGPRFLPADPFQRARVRQAMKMLELYVELPARRLFPGVYFGGVNAELTVSEVEPVLRKGMRALKGLLCCGDFVMGAELTLADFVAVFTLPLASGVAKKVYGWDLLGDFPELEATLAKLGARPSVQQINAESRAAMAAFQQRLAAPKA